MSAFADLAAVRKDLADRVTAAGFRTSPNLPERFSPPLAIVGPDDPYLDFDGATFGSCTVHLIITVIMGAGANAKQADTLDTTLFSLVFASRAPFGPHIVQSIGQPGVVEVNGNKYLAATIHTQIETALSAPTGGNGS